jgi:hypothetical protein
LNPYGFIGKYQGLQAAGKSVQQVAREVFDILVISPKTRGRMLTCLVDTTLQSVHEADALERLRMLQMLPDLPAAYLERLREGAATAAVFAQDQARDALNELLVTRGLRQVTGNEGDARDLDDDLPF